MMRVLVINPNANEQVTDNLRETLDRLASRAAVECVTLASGPFGIETDADVALAASLVVDRVGEEQDYDAFVIACYSDPGLAECRRRTDKSVFGMQESALKEASRDGRRFGVLALSDESIARHLPYIDKLGLREQLAAELPLDISVEQSAADPASLQKVIDTGRRLVEEFGADTIVLGCAGMAALQGAVERALCVPVIEPVRAAVEEAIAAGSA